MHEIDQTERKMRFAKEQIEINPRKEEYIRYRIIQKVHARDLFQQS